jgi:hypothetical protein
VSVSGLLPSSSPFAAATTISRACAARLRTSHCGTGERAPARSARGPRSPRKQWFREGVMAAPNCGRRWARRVLFNGPLCSLLAYSVNFFFVCRFPVENAAHAIRRRIRAHGFEPQIIIRRLRLPLRGFLDWQLPSLARLMEAADRRPGLRAQAKQQKRRGVQLARTMSHAESNSGTRLR